MKKIAIIGATGAIGTAVIDSCINRGTEVYVFVRKESKRVSRIPNNELVHIVNCGMEEMDVFDETSLPNIDAFYFFAWKGTHGTDARNQMYDQIENIKYAIDAVHLAHRLGCKTYVYAGTQAEYGRIEGVISPDTPCNPENGYGIAKHSAGQMTQIECGKYGIKHVWGRIVSTYGPRDGDNSMVSCAIRDCLNGNTPKFTLGEQIWDYLYSGDAGEAFYLMGEKGRNNAIYIVGSGKTKTLREYIEIICKNANPEVTPIFGAVPYMDKQVMHLQADISSLSEDTGFRPKVDFETGIIKTIEWFEKFGNRGE
ncbi:MAG: NAD(P)-dependent oxidoreductase [Lachnospiraceae bacterium]|nr:NAD(P)-dependent oxidoreductase [Lachnospiraceae bacterium]